MFKAAVTTAHEVVFSTDLRGLAALARVDAELVPKVTPEREVSVAGADMTVARAHPVSACRHRRAVRPRAEFCAVPRAPGVRRKGHSAPQGGVEDVPYASHGPLAQGAQKHTSRVGDWLTCGGAQVEDIVADLTAAGLKGDIVGNAEQANETSFPLSLHAMAHADTRVVRARRAL